MATLPPHLKLSTAGSVAASEDWRTPCGIRPNQSTVQQRHLLGADERLVQSLVDFKTGEVCSATYRNSLAVSDRDPGFFQSLMNIAFTNEPHAFVGDSNEGTASPATHDHAHAHLSREADGGKVAWMIVICVFFVNAMFASHLVLFAVYLMDFTTHFGLSQVSLGAIGALETVVTNTMCVFSGQVTRMLGCRVTASLGVGLASLGTLGAAMATDFWMLLLMFGLIRSVGLGFTHVPVNVIVQQYFRRSNRSLAAGLSSLGLSLGSLAFGPIHQLLKQTYGWRGGLLLHTALTLQSLVFTSLLRSPSAYVTAPVDDVISGRDSSADADTTHYDVGREVHCDVKFNNSTDYDAKRIHEASPQLLNGNNNKLSSDQYKQVPPPPSLRPRRAFQLGDVCTRFIKTLNALTGISILSKRWFLLFITGRGLASAGYITMVKYTVKRAVNLGLGEFTASLLLSVNGLCSIGGRLGSSALGNARCTNRTLQYSVCMALNGVTVLVSAFAGSDVTFQFAVHSIYGFTFGAFEALNMTVITDLFGLELLPSAAAWSFATIGMSSLVTLPLTGWLFDETGNYVTSFLLSGGVQIVGSLSLLLQLCHKVEPANLEPA